MLSMKKFVYLKYSINARIIPAAVQVSAIAIPFFSLNFSTRIPNI